MTESVPVAHVEAAKEITLALIPKLRLIASDVDHPEKLAAKVATLYAGIDDAVRNPQNYLKK